MVKEHLVRCAKAQWRGTLAEGQGTVNLESGVLEGQAYSFNSRFEAEEPEITNPEELLAAAHASCYAMQLSAYLTKAGNPPKNVDVKAEIRLDKDGPGFKISSSMLIVNAVVPDMDKEEVLKWAQKAKESCPLSKALASIKIGLEVHVTG